MTTSLNISLPFSQDVAAPPPPPSPWQQLLSPEGRIYYYHVLTGGKPYPLNQYSGTFSFSVGVSAGAKDHTLSDVSKVVSSTQRF